MFFQYYDYYGFMMIYVGIILGCCCLNIIVGAWSYKDAKRRNMDNPELWLIIVLVGGIVGCIVYLIVREPKPEKPPMDVGGTYQTQLEAEQNAYMQDQSYNQNEPSRVDSIKYCPRCGGKIEEGARFCNQCGYDLTS